MPHSTVRFYFSHPHDRPDQNIKKDRRKTRKPLTLLILLVSFVWSFSQSSFAGPGWAWTATSNDNIPFDAVSGGFESGAPLYICRAAFNGGIHPGKTRPDFHGCKFGWGGQEQTVTDYEVLVPRWIAASGDNIPASALQLGAEAPVEPNDFSGPLLFGCRAVYQNGIHPGKVRTGFGGCKFGWGTKEVTAANYEVLLAASVDYVSTSSDPVLSGVLVGGREGTRVLYICRAAYNNGTHPGKFSSDLGGCNIGWGGTEFTAQSYSLVSPHWEKSLDGGIEYAPGEEEGKPLYICRAKYKDGLHPGKYRAELGGCNIGYGGKEVTVTDFELLARPDPCKPLSDKLGTLNQEIDDLVEALASGEIPPPPRTPAKIAAVKAQTQKLRMQAGKVAKQLDQCRQQNP